MLKLKSLRKASTSPLWLPYVKLQISRPGITPPRGSILCRIDTGADRTAMPIDVGVLKLGLSQDEIRTQGKKIVALSVCGTRIQAYVLRLRLNFADDFGGWMEWDDEVAFCDTPKFQSVVGVEGFLEFFQAVTFRPRLTELDPRTAGPSEYIAWRCHAEASRK